MEESRPGFLTSRLLTRIVRRYEDWAGSSSTQKSSDLSIREAGPPYSSPVRFPKDSRPFSTPWPPGIGNEDNPCEWSDLFFRADPPVIQDPVFLSHPQDDIGIADIHTEQHHPLPFFNDLRGPSRA